MTGSTPPQLSQGPLRHLSTNTTRKGIQACVWCKNGLRQWWEKKTWNGDSQESATPINTRCFSLFRSRGETVNNNKLEMNKSPKFCNRSVSKKSILGKLGSWLSPHHDLDCTLTRIKKCNRINRRRPHCIQTQHRKWKGYKRSELKECDGFGPTVFMTILANQTASW